LNPGLRFLGPDSPGIARYGRVRRIAGLEGLLAAAEGIVPSGLEANAYVASAPELEAMPESASLGALFGFADLQIGWNAGPSSRLNGMEWHKSAELLLALRPLALFLGRAEEIEWKAEGGPRWDTRNAVCLFLPHGEALEIFPFTLHLAPCRLEDAGFKSLVVLPRGSNLPLSTRETALAREAVEAGDREARLLFMHNKWIMAHPERKALVERGVHAGVSGENLEIRY
jgi:hypothetical protein